jgi:hypothetical protein
MQEIAFQRPPFFSADFLVLACDGKITQYDPRYVYRHGFRPSKARMH